MPGAISIVLAIIIIGALKFSGKESRLTIKSVIAICLGSLIYAMFSNVSIPIGPDTSFRIAITFFNYFWCSVRSNGWFSSWIYWSCN